MGGIDPDNVHPRIEEGAHLVRSLPGRAKGGDDLGAAYGCRHGPEEV
jgi:hypothetical protein